tara:strand:+ start:38658 stop:38897 length:240 start_codon:yes stop_codon:yes gene_type:complete
MIKLMNKLMHKFLVNAVTLFTILFSPLAISEEFDWAPSINPGDTFPAFSLGDQDGLEQTNASISGENGYLIQFNRSVVW